MLKMLSCFFRDPVARDGDAFVERPVRPDLDGEIRRAARGLAAARQRFVHALREADVAGGVPPELRDAIAAASARLAELARERRIADATEEVQRLRGGFRLGAARRRALKQAEATLDRLRERDLAAAAAVKASAIVAGAAAPQPVPVAVAAKHASP